MYSSYLIVVFLILGISETFSYPNNLNAGNVELSNEELSDGMMERPRKKTYIRFEKDLSPEMKKLYFDCKTINMMDAGKFFTGNKKNLDLNSIKKTCFRLRRERADKRCLDDKKNKPDSPKCPHAESDEMESPTPTKKPKPRRTTTKKPKTRRTTTKKPKTRRTTTKKIKTRRTTTTQREPEPSTSESNEVEDPSLPETDSTKKPKPGRTTRKPKPPCSRPRPGKPCNFPCCGKRPRSDHGYN